MTANYLAEHNEVIAIEPDEIFDMIICHNVLEYAVDIEKWCPGLTITKTLGMRTFWDMQQNPEIHKDTDWQDKMVEVEMRVPDMDEYKNIAFFQRKYRRLRTKL